MHVRRRRRVKCAAVIVVVAVGASIVAAAAQGRDAAPVKSRGPGWTPRWNGDRPGLTVAERAVVEARFAEYERLFAAPESMARPQGFLVRPGTNGALHDGPFGIPSFAYYLVIAPDLRERPEAMSVRENPTARHVWVVNSGGPTLRDTAGDIYLERRRSGPLAGMPPTALVFDGLEFDRQTDARINADKPDYYRFTGSRV